MDDIKETTEQKRKRLARARSQRWRNNMSEEDQQRLRERRSNHSRMKRLSETPEESSARRAKRNFNIRIKRLQELAKEDVDKEITRRSLLLRDVSRKSSPYTSAYVICRAGVQKLDVNHVLEVGRDHCTNRVSKKSLQVDLKEGVEVVDVSKHGVTGRNECIAFETIYCSVTYPGLKEEVPWEDWP